MGPLPHSTAGFDPIKFQHCAGQTHRPARTRLVAQRELPIEIEEFLANNIRSIEQLEILLMLQARPERRWTAGEVNGIIRSSDHSVASTLDQLCKQGLLRCSMESSVPQYQFAPSAALGPTITTLARLYAERRVKIIETIYSERLSEMDEFARAFRLRKDRNA
jgi:hypothetical protein